MTEALYSRVQGEGEPVVLVHGLFGSMENLGALARILSEHCRVYSVDLPNHGRSPHSPTMTLASMAHALKAWLEAEGIARASFVGHSLGGKVAMELALRYPQVVSKLVVIDIAPVAYEPRHTDVFRAFDAVDPASLERRGDADALMSQHVETSAIRSFLLKNLNKTAQGFIWRMNLPVIKQSYSQLIGGNTEGDPFLGDVLFIKGGDSDYVQEEHRGAITQRFPNVSLKIVANTGHWLHAEKPEQVGRMLLRFLLGSPP